MDLSISKERARVFRTPLSLQQLALFVGPQAAVKLHDLARNQTIEVSGDWSSGDMHVCTFEAVESVEYSLKIDQLASSLPCHYRIYTTSSQEAFLGVTRDAEMERETEWPQLYVAMHFVGHITNAVSPNDASIELTLWTHNKAEEWQEPQLQRNLTATIRRGFAYNLLFDVWRCTTPNQQFYARFSYLDAIGSRFTRMLTGICATDN